MYDNEIQKSSNMLLATHEIHTVLQSSTRGEGLCQLFYLLSDLAQEKKTIFQSLPCRKKKKGQLIFCSQKRSREGLHVNSYLDRIGASIDLYRYMRYIQEHLYIFWSACEYIQDWSIYISIQIYTGASIYLQECV